MALVARQKWELIQILEKQNKFVKNFKNNNNWVKNESYRTNLRKTITEKGRTVKY